MTIKMVQRSLDNLNTKRFNQVSNKLFRAYGPDAVSTKIIIQNTSLGGIVKDYIRCLKSLCGFTTSTSVFGCIL